MQIYNRKIKTSSNFSYYLFNIKCFSLTSVFFSKNSFSVLIKDINC